jgi:hypothetical protein
VGSWQLDEAANCLPTVAQADVTALRAALDESSAAGLILLVSRLDSLLDFQIDVALDGEPLTAPTKTTNKRGTATAIASSSTKKRGREIAR